MGHADRLVAAHAHVVVDAGQGVLFFPSSHLCDLDLSLLCDFSLLSAVNEVVG